jgi:signal transduction histidine kinase
MRVGSSRLIVGLGGTLFALVGEGYALQDGRSPSVALLHLAIGLTYLYGGLAIWAHEPRNRTGKLMAAVGVTWFIGTYDGIPVPFLSDLAFALEDTPTVLLLALILMYPTGRLADRWDRLAVAILAVGATALNVAFSTSLQLVPIPSLGLYGGLFLATMTTAMIIRRWVIAPARERRDLVPVLVAGLVFLLTLSINLIGRIANVPDDVRAVLVAARDLAPAAIPIALLVGFYRQSERRMKALVEALPDRMLRYSRDGEYVAIGSLSRTADATVPGGRALFDVTFAAAGPAALAAADRALATGELQGFDFELDLDGRRRHLEARVTPSGADEVTAIVRDFTEQRAVEAELRRSRARIVEAADAERRRLERDLHDGAQQRLVALSLALRLLRAKLVGNGRPVDPEALAAADQAAAELKLAIAELRELARGIHPAILTEAGLSSAMTALAERSAVPATVTATPDRRLSPGVEATAYFVVSESLANVAKYAHATRATVAAPIVGSTLRVEVADDGVGGADGARGSGIRGLQDRVAALGGRLTVESPQGQGTRVVAEIPVA